MVSVQKKGVSGVKKFKIVTFINIRILLILIKLRKISKMPKNKEGTKTIKLGIYFWTNVDKSDDIELPKKTCWDSGFVNIVSNNRHGIRSGVFKNFNSFEEISSAIKDVLKRSEVKVVQSKRDKEYKKALRKIKEAELV